MRVAIIGFEKVGIETLRAIMGGNASVSLEMVVMTPHIEKAAPLIRDLQMAASIKPARAMIDPSVFIPSIELGAMPEILAAADLVIMTTDENADPKEKQLNIRRHSQAVARYAPKALVVVADPFDVLPEIARLFFKKPHHVLGFGAMVESLRFVHLANNYMAAQGIEGKVSMEGPHLIGPHNGVKRFLTSSLPHQLNRTDLARIMNTMQSGPSLSDIFDGVAAAPIAIGAMLATAVFAWCGQKEQMTGSFNVRVDQAAATHYGVAEGASITVPLKLGRGARYEFDTDYVITDFEKAIFVEPPMSGVMPRQALKNRTILMGGGGVINKKA